MVLAGVGTAVQQSCESAVVVVVAAVVVVVVVAAAVVAAAVVVAAVVHWGAVDCCLYHFERLVG